MSFILRLDVYFNVVFLQNLKDVLADLIPKEQSRIKNFKQQYGKTNIGQITVDMVSNSSALKPQINKFARFLCDTLI